MKWTVYVSHFDVKTNIFEFRNYDTKELRYMTVPEFKEFVNSQKKCIIIYQNSVNIIERFLPGGEKKGEKEPKYGDGSKEIISYTIGKVRFKSFSVMCPTDQNSETMMHMYNVGSHTESMIAHLEYLKDLGGGKLKSTICGQSQLIFYKDIRYDLWEDKKKRVVYINNLWQFKMCHAGCKCGLLTKVKNLKSRGKTVEHDLSAAYCGAFIQSDKFPIGKPIFTKNASIFYEEIVKGNNVKVVFNKRIPEIDEATKQFDLDLFDDFNGVLALEYYDLKMLSEIGINICEIIKKYYSFIETFVIYRETGRIHHLIKDKIVKLQKEKDILKKGTPERSIVKCQMEFVYGKPIQKRDYWNSDEDVVKNYKGRGENYIMPHMSNHASAYVRYQIFKAIQALGEDVYYYDTDGIKVADNEKTWNYFAEENARLFELNKESGYNTDIGTWKYEEFEDFIAVGSKMYITRKDKKFDLTIAGMNKDCKDICINFMREAFNLKGPNLISTIEKEGFPFFYVAIIPLYSNSECIGVEYSIQPGSIIKGDEFDAKKEERRIRISKVDNKEQQVQREIVRSSQ